MKIIEKEERYMKRFRKGWHRLFRIGRNVFAAIGLVLVVVLITMITLETDRREAYRAELMLLNEMVKANPTEAQELYVDISLFETVNELFDTLDERYTTAIDLLGIEKDIRGFYVSHDMRPVEKAGFRTIVSQLVLFTDCGCDEDGMYDIITLQLNPATLKVSVTDVLRSVMLETFKPLYRYSS